MMANLSFDKDKLLHYWRRYSTLAVDLLLVLGVLFVYNAINESSTAALEQKIQLETYRLKAARLKHEKLVLLKDIPPLSDSAERFELLAQACDADNRNGTIERSDSGKSKRFTGSIEGHVTSLTACIMVHTRDLPIEFTDISIAGDRASLNYTIYGV